MPRVAAARALVPVLTGKASLGTSLPTLLERVAERDRGLTQELAYGTARWYPRLQGLSQQMLQKPFKATDVDLEALLLVGFYQLLHTRIPAHAAISETVQGCTALKKPWAKGLLNAVLRRTQREGKDLLENMEKDPVIRLAHPRWLQKSLKQYWPEHWEHICQANNQRPPMTLRVNQQKVSRDAYLQNLQQAQITAQPCQYSPVGLQLETPCDVNLLPGFNEGMVSVQDEAAQLSTPFLDVTSGQRVLDACCAPGGKSCHLLEHHPDLEMLLALDLEGERLKRVADNLHRLGLKAQLQTADARATASWWDGRPFQRILLDAPCSATGVIRRHPDIKLTRQAEDIIHLAQLQGELLDALWPTLAIGGTLLYATCSILPVENREVIARFLERTPSARELDLMAPYGIPQHPGLQLLPQINGPDGFYYAKLIKLSSAPV